MAVITYLVFVVVSMAGTLIIYLMFSMDTQTLLLCLAINYVSAIIVAAVMIYQRKPYE